MENIDRYEAGVARARDGLHSAPAIRALLDPETDPELLEAFLIYFSALGVGMTALVEGWIRRAGERCCAVGFDHLGKALQRHANAEADHHLLMVDDVRTLCERWNAGGKPPFDPEELLRIPMRESTERYRKLHEEVIAGDAPYAQLAIENEIEMLSVELGAGLLENCRRLLGDQVVAALSFLGEHIELDVGHTKFNRLQLAEFLRGRPEAIDPLVTAGTAALEAYRDFLTDCTELAGAVRAPVG